MSACLWGEPYTWANRLLRSNGSFKHFIQRSSFWGRTTSSRNRWGRQLVYHCVQYELRLLPEFSNFSRLAKPNRYCQFGAILPGCSRTDVELAEDEVHFIGWVSPFYVVPGLLKIFSIARERGLETPIIYNTNGYDTLATLKLLDGVVDVYLPDLKYIDSTTAKGISHIHEHP
jgi:hypothetical protein